MGAGQDDVKTILSEGAPNEEIFRSIQQRALLREVSKSR